MALADARDVDRILVNDRVGGTGEHAVTGKMVRAAFEGRAQLLFVRLTCRVVRHRDLEFERHRGSFLDVTVRATDGARIVVFLAVVHLEVATVLADLPHVSDHLFEPLDDGFAFGVEAGERSPILVRLAAGAVESHAVVGFVTAEVGNDVADRLFFNRDYGHRSSSLRTVRRTGRPQRRQSSRSAVSRYKR